MLTYAEEEESFAFRFLVPEALKGGGKIVLDRYSLYLCTSKASSKQVGGGRLVLDRYSLYLCTSKASKKKKCLSDTVLSVSFSKMWT